MLENDSNKHDKNIISNKYSVENLIPFSDCNINDANIMKMISKLERIVKTLEDEVLILKKKACNKIN